MFAAPRSDAGHSLAKPRPPMQSGSTSTHRFSQESPKDSLPGYLASEQAAATGSGDELTEATTAVNTEMCSWHEHRPQDPTSVPKTKIHRDTTAACAAPATTVAAAGPRPTRSCLAGPRDPGRASDGRSLPHRLVLQRLGAGHAGKTPAVHRTGRHAHRIVVAHRAAQGRLSDGACLLAACRGPGAVIRGRLRRSSLARRRIAAHPARRHRHTPGRCGDSSGMAGMLAGIHRPDARPRADTAWQRCTLRRTGRGVLEHRRPDPELLEPDR